MHTIEVKDMFYKKNSSGYKEVMDGINIKTLVYGEKTLLTEFRLNRGKELTKHKHPHEQTGYLVSGRMDLIIGDEIFKAHPGDSWNIAGDIEHGANVIEDSVAIEVFSPVREDYLP